ncbi:MAG: TonB-dependent receptor plug domain-containing protein [Gemmatimonadetes bacterium]|nr:TonB-dependent receptor plug domain-containing protein [Gemmatimonadota bacterium]
MAVRIALGSEAIELDPVVVTARGERERRNRGRGVRINELTADEIETLIPTSRNLADVLQQTIPSLRSVPSTVANGYNCIEFRNPATIRFAGDCRSPMTLVDGIRMFDPPTLFSTIDLNSISRIELIPPAEAGAEYGSDSAFGVLVIETKSFSTERARNGAQDRPMPGELAGTWNWDLEGSSHPSTRVFLYSFLGNAAGLAAGLALARQCVEFDRLAVDVFNSSCGRWGTFGARSAALSIPVFGASAAARFAGRTDFSHGRFWPTALAAGVALLPGYAIASSSTVDGFQGTTWISRFILLFGVPAATTLADYMYRRFDGS